MPPVTAHLASAKLKATTLSKRIRQRWRAPKRTDRTGIPDRRFRDHNATAQPDVRSASDAIFNRAKHGSAHPKLTFLVII